MRTPDTVLRRLVGTTAVLVLGLAGLLVGGVANAQTTDGTFVPLDASTSLPIVNGTDSTIIKGLTGGTCDSSPTADGYNGVVSGPGVFAPSPPIRPDGLQVVVSSDLGFSTTDPIPFTLRGNFKDFAAELGGTVVPGDYTITVRCVDQFDGTIFQKFGATLRFSSPTAFTVVGGGSSTPVPSGSPTPAPSGVATPTPAPSGVATPTPTPSGGVTPTPMPSDSATPAPVPSDGVTPTPLPSGSADPTPQPDPATPTPVPVAGSGGSSGSGGNLAYTGTPLDVLLPLAGALLAAGFGLRLLARRRRLRG